MSCGMRPMRRSAAPDASVMSWAFNATNSAIGHGLVDVVTEWNGAVAAHIRSVLHFVACQL